MGQRVARIARDRALVEPDRVVQLAALDEHVSQVGERGRIPGLRGQRRIEILAGFARTPESDPRYAPLVIEKRAVGGSRLGGEQRRQRPLGAREVARVERLERTSKSFPAANHPAMFTIDVVTLFPEVFAPFVGLSIVGRAVESGVVQIRYHHLLDELANGERADDAPFGGGPGMVLRIEPIARVLDAIAGQAPAGERRAIVVPSPIGPRFAQADAQRWAGLDRLVIVCGHYEGIDDRLGALYPVEERSLGDFVVTGGELPALTFMDATVRLLAGALAPASLEHESFTGGALDYPSYTRPANFRGVDVPEVLLSGDHARIARWRREQSRLRTAARRADLLHPDEGA